MGIDVWMRNSAYVTYRTERLTTIPENVTQDLSRYTTIVVVGDRATGWRGPNPNIRSLRAAYLVATGAQDSPGGVGRPDGGRASSLHPAPVFSGTDINSPQSPGNISRGFPFRMPCRTLSLVSTQPYVMYRAT